MLKRKAIWMSASAVAVAMSAAPPAPAAPHASYPGDAVIVKYRPNVSPAEREALADRAGVGRTVERLGVVDARVARVSGEPAAAAKRLERSSKVAYAEPDSVVRAAARRPSDPRFGRLWALHNVGQNHGLPDADIDALGGWSHAGLTGFPATGGAAVGVVDTGIDPTHPDLQGRVQDCATFLGTVPVTGCADDPQPGHGTHVAGTVGATADNGVGVTGVAFNSPLIVCRALGGPSASGRVSDVAECIDWVREHGADVISMSFEGGPSETLRRAVRRAWDGGDGAVLVAAAGNDDGYHASYPGAFRHVISVAATTRRDEPARFSNRHRTVDLAAPGTSILSTEAGGGYVAKSGTSMATPHAAGVAAQLRTLRPGASARRIRSLLHRSAEDLGPRGRDPMFGHGRVNLARAVGR